MKPVPCLLLGLVFLAPCRQLRAQGLLTVPTGEPTVIGVYAGARPMSEAAYLAAAAANADARLVPLRNPGSGLSPKATFGSGLWFGGVDHSWALDGDADVGYTFRADFDADGDLSDETSIRFEKGDAKPGYSAVHRTTLVDTVGGGRTPYPYLLGIHLAEVTAGPGTGTFQMLGWHARMLREGTIEVGGERLKFGLVGSYGLFFRDTDAVYFDVDRDGALDLAAENNAAAPASNERFPISGGHVDVGGTTYAYRVDRYGRSITLEPVVATPAGGGRVAVGEPVPDFAFTDAEGRLRRLSELRGKVVLIDFWGTWCAPCVAEVPHLKEAYAALRDRGLEIVSVNANDDEEVFRRFVAARRMTWFHAREGEGGPLQALFQVRAFPSYFVVGRDGRLLRSHVGRGGIAAQLAGLVSSRPGG